MIFVKQDLLAGAVAAGCAGLLLAISYQAAAQTVRHQARDTTALAVESSRVAATRFFIVPTIDPNTAALMPVQPLQIAGLMTVPGQRFDWRRRGRFGARELLDLPLAALRRGYVAVPPVYLGRFPTHLADLRDASQRKDIFIKTVLPLVLRVNDEIRAARQRLQTLAQRSQAQGGLSAGDQAFMRDLAAQYEVAEGDFDELQRRVDVVPASLALAQGAEESGWGTSRFARMGNAVFGQRTFRKGGGLVPRKRSAGQSFEVKAFNTLYTSVHAYVRNLNTHFAYKTFRKKRAAFRGAGQPLDGYVLTGTLNSYSERGHKYIDTIRVIMRANRLHDFDNVRLLAENGDFRPS